MNAFQIPAYAQRPWGRDDLASSSSRPNLTSILSACGRRQKTGVGRVAILALCAVTAAVANAAQDDEVVAVYSSKAPSYTRLELSDGSIKPETYAFGEGESQGGAMKDYTLDNIQFIDVARVIAPALSAQHYVPCDRRDPNKTDLLIMVYWGATVGTDHTSSSVSYQTAQAFTPAPKTYRMETRIDPDTMKACANTEGNMIYDAQARVVEQASNDSALQQSLSLTHLANRERDRQDSENAAILGFTPELARYNRADSPLLSLRRHDLLEEVEESRYYVVLMAYDFQRILHRKEKVLLWETRFSIRQTRNNFREQLAAMTKTASRYFGQNTGGIEHPSIGEGHVGIGDMKVLGVVPDQR